jgi:DNA-binding NarL/FixJ family response regulator
MGKAVAFLSVMSGIRVLLIDDHALVREGIRKILEQESGFEIVGEFGDARAAIKKLKSLGPDVVLMDVSMPGLTGIQATEEVKRTLPRTKVLVLSMYDNDNYIRNSFEAGASGYLLKDAGSAELLSAIRATAKGESYLSPQIAKKMISGFLSKKSTKPVTTPFDTLTRREREILKLLAEGSSSKEISALLDINVGTVRTHRANLMRKLGAHNLSDLTRTAAKCGLIEI